VENRPVRKERLAAERSEQILRAATRVFSRKNFHEATIHDVAQEAGLADGTIYLYFRNKRDLLLSVLTRPYSALLLTALGGAEISGEDDRGLLTDILRRGVTLALANVDTIRFFMSAMQEVDNQVRAEAFRNLFQVGTIFEEYLRERIATGAFRPCDPAIVSRAFFGMFIIFILGQEVMMGKNVVPISYEKVIPEVVELFLTGVTSPKEPAR